MNKKEIVEQFLTTVFDDALIADLEKMKSVPYPGLDFGIITLVCSGIELIGALHHGAIAKLHSKPKSRQLFEEALEKYFQDRYRSQAIKQALWGLFRCGLAHQAFVKPGVATTRNPEYKHCHLKGVLVEGKQLLFIHPDVFADDFFQAVKKFRSSLDDDPQRIERAYCTIHEIYETVPTIDMSSIEQCYLHISANFTRLPQPVWLEKSEVEVRER